MTYKNYTIELINGVVGTLYQIYDKEGYYKGQATTIKEAKEIINNL